MSSSTANPRDVRVGKFLSLVLRHEPGKIGITLDAAGWTDVDALLAAMAAHGKPLTRAELAALVAGSDKQRYALSDDGHRIRANQGHSVEVELGHATATPPGGAVPRDAGAKFGGHPNRGAAEDGPAPTSTCRPTRR